MGMATIAHADILDRPSSKAMSALDAFRMESATLVSHIHDNLELVGDHLDVPLCGMSTLRKGLSYSRLNLPSRMLQVRGGHLGLVLPRVICTLVAAVTCVADHVW